MVYKIGYYDGDMLTDQNTQVHWSHSFISPNLIGKYDEGYIIKEFEASYRSVTDLLPRNHSRKPSRNNLCHNNIISMIFLLMWALPIFLLHSNHFQLP